MLRRVHLLHPTLLPSNLLEAIKPNAQDLNGNYGLVSDRSFWDSAPGRDHSVTVKLHGSSDGVRPFKTGKSSVRCIMGSLDYIESKQLGIRVYIPDSPPFLIGVYKGIDKEDDAVLQPLVSEMKLLRPPPKRKDEEVSQDMSTAYMM